MRIKRFWSTSSMLLYNTWHELMMIQTNCYASCSFSLYLLTSLLTPWSRVFIEKLIGFQVVKKFPTFYGTRLFIAAFTSVRHLSLSWARSIQSMPPHPTSWRSIIPSHLRLGLLSDLFPSGLPTKTLCTPVLSLTHATWSASHSSRFYHPNKIGWVVQTIKLLIM